MDEEDAFLTGLLHDIGNVIVLRIMLDNNAVAQYDLDASTFDYLCFETHSEQVRWQSKLARLRLNVMLAVYRRPACGRDRGAA